MSDDDDIDPYVAVLVGSTVDIARIILLKIISVLGTLSEGYLVCTILYGDLSSTKLSSRSIYKCNSQDDVKW